MVFSSNCPQLTNSNHQHPQLHENGYGLLLSQQLPSLQANPNSNHHHAASFSGLPADDRMGGSMVEKARQAKLPPPEGALKCPRCDSTNTKFCYYNNYNLTQPRHFCKACRRYWTQGGALRNVPVGGGCRRNNKKSKTGNSKSSSKQSSMVNTPSPSSGQLIRTDHQFPFSSPTHYNLTQLGGISLNLAGTNDDNNQAHQIGSSLMNDLGLLLVGNERNTSDLMTGAIHESNNNNENNLMASVGSLTHYALFDPTTGLYAFQNEGNIGSNVGVSSSSPYMVDSRVYQTAPVKTEEQSSLANLSRPVSGLTAPGNHTNQYFWTGSDFSAPSNELL